MVFESLIREPPRLDTHTSKWNIGHCFLTQPHPHGKLLCFPIGLGHLAAVFAAGTRVCTSFPCIHEALSSKQLFGQTKTSTFRRTFRSFILTRYGSIVLFPTGPARACANRCLDPRGTSTKLSITSPRPSPSTPLHPLRALPCSLPLFLSFLQLLPRQSVTHITELCTRASA